MKKILVPVDFTAASLAASKYAASLARLLGADLYLVHAYIEPVPLEPSPSVWIITNSSIQELNDNRIKEEISYLSGTYSIPVYGEAIVGYKGDTINDYADKIKADLIVMGRKSEKKNPLLGSTIFKAIRKTDLPVLIVPEAVSYAPISFMTLALDFDPLHSSSSFNFLFSLVKQLHATLHVLHVEPKGVEVKAMENEQKAKVSRAFSGISFWYDEIEEDDVDLGIEHYTEDHPTDILVMVARHHSIFERVFGTTHTRFLCFKVQIPLLVLPNK